MITDRGDTEEARKVNPLAGRETMSMLMGIFEAARVVPRTAPSVILPLTIISGFLGAGKTTLVNRLLSDPGGRRIAVLVNDFAAVNIDEELIRFQGGDTIGLTNGCACCSINGDLVNAIQRLVERDEPPDAVVLEASGVADPRGIAQVALANPALKLDSIVTLVDAETFAERLRDDRTRSTVMTQLSAADIVAVNKTDLAGNRSEILALVAAYAPGRTLVETRHSNIPVEVVLGATGSASSTFMCAPANHVSGFSSMTRSWESPLHKDAMLGALRRLPPYVVRAKGTFCFEGEEHKRYVYQRVGKRECLEALDGSCAPHPGSKLVLVGYADRWKESELAALIS